ncbi:MAG TPA: indolepyruvate ferredoxin oxidoreductase family protein [Alphaproteobacteria bacterium]|nr:indolepyruvate ferredoxin oxidoreductase family protein [Alphaproteobacteria bacterium]
MAIPAAQRLTADSGIAHLSCGEALVRALLDQRRADAARGWNTAGFVSGYRGSPLGRLDQTLESAERILRDHAITFTPGINEELAATALYGAQQAALFPGATTDGVFGLWYAKGPGVDRAGDALKHANYAGTAPKGGVVAVAGDDHEASSSTLAHQSEPALIAAHIPVLAPWDVQSAYDLALAAIAASRASGFWIGLKLAGDVAEASATIAVGARHGEFTMPPESDVHIRARDRALDQEKRLALKRLALHEFVRANNLDKVHGAHGAARLGIVAVGASWGETRSALRRLGISDSDLARLGIRVLVPALVWPLEPETLAGFAEGLDEIVVIEDKRPLVEGQIKELLFNAEKRPRIVGKHDERGMPLLPETGRIGAERIAAILAPRLGLAAPARATSAPRKDEPRRTPHYCPGCPHATSTRTLDGSQTLAGIGCHTMALWTDANTSSLVPMGNEGAAWIGLSPFVDRPHVFQNLGDGTFVHSGILAVRAAVAARVNITFKLLWNGAVAMTGGQELDAPLTVPAVARELAAEGVARIAVVTDDRTRYRTEDQFPIGTHVVGRDEFEIIEDELRDTKGVTVLIYDQACAAELLRKRARGESPPPERRIAINERLCEGCGDCTAKTNCLAVVPVQTAFGEKRRIDQDSCTQDLTCLEGMCPAIVTLDGARMKRNQRATLEVPAHLRTLPDPEAQAPVAAILVAGVGGRGVVTTARILARAALHDGHAAAVLDQTGLAQKGGAVLSHVRVSTGTAPPPRIGAGDADLVLGLDPLVTAGARALDTVAPGRSRVLLASEAAPTAKGGRDSRARPDAVALVATIAERTGETRMMALPAESIARACAGRSIAANLVLLGYAYQAGWLPFTKGALLSAIAEDGDDIAKREAFLWGRRAFVDRAGVEALAGLAPRAPEPLADLIARLKGELVAYEDELLAARFETLVNTVADAERARAPRASGLTEAVARNYFKLLAAKDEYESARLLTSTAFHSDIDAAFVGARLRYHLTLPGASHKVTLGRWAYLPLKLLASARKLRGTAFDPFRFRRVRVLERALVTEYEEGVTRALDALSPTTHDIVLRLARLPDAIRGFGEVKERSAAAARLRRIELLSALAPVGASSVAVPAA